MPRNSGIANLYIPHVKGRFIYKLKNRVDGRYSAQYHYQGLIKSGAFYSAEEARQWIDHEIAHWEAKSPAVFPSGPAVCNSGSA